jgi:multicomponent Na+:H+ antiporter subunit E
MTADDRTAEERPRRRSIGRMLHSVWRYGFITWAWYLTRLLVWLRFHLKLPRWLRKWLGGDGREIAMRLWNLTWLTFVWVLLWGDITWGNIAAGLVVAILVVTLLPLPRVPVEGRVHLLPLLNLAVRLVFDLFKSSIQVAWLALRPARPPMTAVLRARLALKSDLSLTFAIDYLNLVPGTIVVDFDHDRRVVYVHLVDVSSERSVSNFYKQMATIERLFNRAFERDSEWHASPYHGIDEEYELRREGTVK